MAQRERSSYHGCNLRVARKIWKKLGGSVNDKRGTGEEVYCHPNVPVSIVVDKRRKDSPRVLTIWINDLIARNEA